MTKTIDTLIPDIYALFTKKEHIVSEEGIDHFVSALGNMLKDRLTKIPEETEVKRDILRLSKIGTGDRKLWYEAENKRKIEEEGEEAQGVIDSSPKPNDYIKFLYGDIIEELILFLAKEAGHTVEGEQGEILINGVLGHRDCIIDGITTDVKSTSRFAFDKFAKGKLFGDDPFGYIAQISAYATADKSPFGAFLAMNKETGELAMLKVEQIDMINPDNRIDHIREVLAQPEPPEEKCYPDEPMGKSGNRALNSNCGYCPFKNKCWSHANGGQGLRAFNYSNGTKYLTQVVDTPSVKEVTSEDN